MTVGSPQPDYDAPAAVVEQVLAAPRPTLLALDVDGVLAPIVDHADEARLIAGVPELLDALATLTPVAIVSGRSMHNLLSQFEFPDGLEIYGSHGLESRNEPAPPLDAVEQERLDVLIALADQAAALAGEGAWIERKPASVVLQVRQTDSRAGTSALAWLDQQAAGVAGAEMKHGSAVLELMVRPGNKASALTAARDACRARSAVYIGDDVTDEDALRTLGDDDIGVRVGPGATAAALRLRDPEAVVAVLAGVLAELRVTRP
jgi:trehalose 6-phosphate phosphatase